jgi:hypothetical protein
MACCLASVSVAQGNISTYQTASTEVSFVTGTVSEHLSEYQPTVSMHW